MIETLYSEGLYLFDLNENKKYLIITIYYHANGEIICDRNPIRFFCKCDPEFQLSHDSVSQLSQYGLLMAHT